MSLSAIQGAAPRIGVVLGSGLGAVAEALGMEAEVSYGEVPGLHVSTVPGHAGRFVLVKPNGVPVLIAQGRSHLYEGLPAAQVTAQVRVMHGLGVRTLLLSNAAGAINNSFRVGELMLLSDHLNLTGTSPLLGGPNFKDMTEVYSKRLRATLHRIAKAEDIPLHEGVYAGLLGPQYETPAEIRMLRTLGADAVGMSTVLEAIQANALGMQVVGVSTLTNWAAGLGDGVLSHEEVMATGKSVIGQMTALVRGLALSKE
jgi:purine-nucleoside phosphorylase